MGAIIRPARPPRVRSPLLGCLLFVTFLGAWCVRTLLSEVWTLAALPLIWWNHSESFLISAKADGFDLSFANYSRGQLSAAPFEDRIPPILHHIAMGTGAAEHTGRWRAERQSCIDMHPGWEVHLWTDETAGVFVAEHFPELQDMWETYRYPIQRIDALRYMILYHYGGKTTRDGGAIV